MERRVTAAKAGGKKRTPIFGPEPWTEIGGSTWSHFDRWYALVIVHDGDPGRARGRPGKAIKYRAHRRRGQGLPPGGPRPA